MAAYSEDAPPKTCGNCGTRCYYNERDCPWRDKGCGLWMPKEPARAKDPCSGCAEQGNDPCATRWCRHHKAYRGAGGSYQEPKDPPRTCGGCLYWADSVCKITPQRGRAARAWACDEWESA